jgi:hypothetical protein
MTLSRAVLLAALVTNAMLVGASLDQSVKQLPARQRIGPVAFSQYSRAADLANGVPFYATLGLGAAVLSLAASVVGLRQRRRSRVLTLALLALAVLTVAHSLVTAVAAPTNFSQLSVSGEDALAAVFDRFARLQAIRAALQVLTLVSALIAWAAVLGSPGDADRQ